MKDEVSRIRVKALHPKFIPSAISFINDVESLTGYTWRIVQGFRSFEEQAVLYAQGRTKPGPIVTYSPPGTSYHNYGLAIDIAPIINKVIDWHYDYRKLRKLSNKYGFQMGLDFPHPDYDHFENKFGHNWRDLLHKYTIKDFIPGTHLVNI
jgi:peptidoglycan LD-endopeptidase CwlK